LKSDLKGPSSSKGNALSSKEREMREAKNLEKEMERALELKNHYFGEKQVKTHPYIRMEVKKKKKFN